ncbi:hypothetical protein D3C75_618030 [compost metagenome]
MISVTRVTALTISPIVSPALSTSVEPVSTLLTESSIRPLISFAACALRCARLRTSPATTAKPRPCSPARAASTAAFSARILVWKAMPSITLVMSAIFFELPAMSFMVRTTLSTTLPPFCAVSDALNANWLAWRAFSAFCLTVAVNCSMLAAVSSSEAACCSVREDRSLLPIEISLAPL